MFHSLLLFWIVCIINGLIICTRLHAFYNLRMGINYSQNTLIFLNADDRTNWQDYICHATKFQPWVPWRRGIVNQSCVRDGVTFLACMLGNTDLQPLVQILKYSCALLIVVIFKTKSDKFSFYVKNCKFKGSCLEMARVTISGIELDRLGFYT